MKDTVVLQGPEWGRITVKKTRLRIVKGKIERKNTQKEWEDWGHTVRWTRMEGPLQCKTCLIVYVVAYMSQILVHEVQ